MPQTSLQEVINQIKKDLMSELDTVDNPLFMVEKVEIEMAVNVTSDGRGNVSIWIVDVGGGVSKEYTNTVKVILTPLLSHDEVRDLIKSDAESSLKLRKTSRALIKGDSGMVGEPE